MGITDPTNELKALALAYVQQQDLREFTPAQVVNFYDSVLKKMWEQFEIRYKQK